MRNAAVVGLAAILARAVRDAALDLFGPGSDVFGAVHQALNAAGPGVGESDE